MNIDDAEYRIPRWSLSSGSPKARPGGGVSRSKIGRRPSSKPRKVGEGELAAVDVHAAEFGAAVQGWKYLAGIEQALRVERAFQPLLLVEVDLAEHLRHQVALLDADAMFAGQHAAEFDADPQDIGAEGFGPLHFAGLVGIVQDQRMQIRSEERRV